MRDSANVVSVVIKGCSIKKSDQYRGDTAVVHSSTLITVPHRSQWISIRNNSSGNKNPITIHFIIYTLIETELEWSL